MCVCIYICMYVLCVHAHVCVCACAHTHTHRYNTCAVDFNLSLYLIFTSFSCEKCLIVFTQAISYCSMRLKVVAGTKQFSLC